MKNRKQQVENELWNESLEEFPHTSINPKQGLSGKKHCICVDCDIFGCDNNCNVCMNYLKDLFDDF